jgi:hypothetical protein
MIKKDKQILDQHSCTDTFDKYGPWLESANATKMYFTYDCIFQQKQTRGRERVM